MSRFYLVQILREWGSLGIDGKPLSVPLDGCIGFLPVFEDEASAQAFIDEHHPGATVIPIEATQAVTR